MATNLEIAAVAATQFVAQDYIEQYDIEDGSDIAELFNGTGLLFPKDTLFAFGEFCQVLVLVKDGVAISAALGGVEDNRGQTVEGDYSLSNGKEVSFNNDNEDPDIAYWEVYTDLFNQMSQ